MGTSRKVLLTLLVVGLLGGVAVVGTLSAFSSTTTNTDNSFAAGTVTLADNDSGAVLYGVANQKPGVNTVKCIKLTYTGSLDADVKLYTPSSVNASAQYINLTIEKGTSDTAVFPNCGTFTSQSTVYSGTLANFAATRNSYANGILAFPGAQSAWAQNDTLVYRFTLSVQDDNAAQGASSGLHTFTWEARNQ
jgi:predicted ribosomally synthesized peptide with SipW-like signal peptide